MVLLSEDVDLLRAVGYLGTAFIKLPLQTDILSLQLTVLFLQQDHPLLLLATRLLQGLVHSGQLLLLAAVTLQTALALPHSLKSFITLF